MAGGKEQRKAKYRVMSILLLMKCIRILLREMVRKIAIQKTPDGESEWTVDDYLCHNKKRIERKLLKIDSNDRYLNVLFPSDSKEKTEAGAWDLTLYIFILNDIVMIKGKLKSYMRKILDIRNDICGPYSSGVTRYMCKLYRRRIRKAKHLLYKNICDKELKKTIDRRVHNIEKGKMLASEVEKVLDRWKDLESEKGKTGPGKSGIDRFFTVETMLSEVCCEVMQALVRRRFRDLGHHCLDSFLRHYETRIRRQIHILDKWGRAEQILLPRKGETKIEEWDISLLCWVLLNLCYLGDIKVRDEPLIADAVGRFRTVRNETIHERIKSLSKDKYNSNMEDIRRSIQDCLDFLGDADLSEDINDQIEDIENGDTEKEETMRRCQIAYQNTCTEHELEKKYLEDNVNIQRQLSEIVVKFKDVTIPECQLELMIEDCGQHHSQMLSHLLVAKINETISGRQSIATLEDDEMTRAVTNLIDTWKSKGWNLISSKEGSVLLDIKCTSFNTLCDLYDAYQNGGSTLHVGEIQDVAQHVTGTRVKLHFIMYDVEMFKCMENIVCTLLENISQLTTTKRKYGIGNGSRINILMTPDARVCNGSISDISSLTCEDVVGQLSRLADILRKQNGLTSCSIRVNSHDFCVHPQSPEMQCFGNNEDDQNETMAWTSTDDEQFMSWMTLPPDENCMTEVQNSIQPSKDLGVLGQEQEYSFFKLLPPDKQLGLDTNAQMSVETATYSIKTTSPDRCRFSENGIGGPGAFQENPFEIFPEALKEPNKETNKVQGLENVSDTMKATVGDRYQNLEGGIEESEIYMRKTHEDLKKEMQADLIQHYRTYMYSAIPISPLFEEIDNPLIDFYVMPTLKIEDEFAGTRSKLVTSYKDIFEKDCQTVGNIYLQARAGCGKSLFAERMALAWCQAHLPDELTKVYFSEFHQDLQVMKDFEYLFLISLRDVDADHCDIDQMIRFNILLSIAQYYPDYVLTHILDTRKCLIILDGLDEWTRARKCTCSSISKELYIPHRKVRKMCTILTTTRPWILSISPIQIDRKIEIAYYEESFSTRLTESLTMHLNDKYKTQRDPSDFERVMTESPRNSWRRTPLIIMQLLCLWYQNKPLSKSMSQIFSGIVECMFKRAERNPENAQLHPYRRTNGQSEKTGLITLPCKTHSELLVSLGQLAFNQLFNGDQSCLLFSTRTAETIMSTTELSFAFATGIVVQKKTPGRSSISFTHRTLQEYLAAIYISRKNLSPLDLLSKCNSVDKLLDSSTMFAFLSGLNHQKMYEMYSALGNLISNDECTKQYRGSSAVNVLTLRMLHLQNFMVDCLEENINCGNENMLLPLADVVLLSSKLDSYSDQYLSSVSYLMGKQKQNVKTVYIECLQNETENTLQEIFLSLQHLQKIEAVAAIDMLCILPRMILKSAGALKCLYISTEINEETVNAVKKLEQLEMVSLMDISLSHQQLHMLREHFSEMNSLRNVTLHKCYCSNHGIHCDVIHDLNHMVPDIQG